MRNVYWKRRNVSAAGILVLYILTNAIGLATLHFSTADRMEHYKMFAVEMVLILGIVLTCLFVAACWFWARAKGWSGWVGALAAFAGTIFWGVSACYLLYPSVGQNVNLVGAPRVYDDRLPVLPWIAFTVSAIILKLLPARQAKTALADAQQPG